jgi:hypothetical protein
VEGQFYHLINPQWPFLLLLTRIRRPQSQNAPTRSEQLTLEAEMDGTREAERKAEEKREEEEQWAQYTDLHPKGEGNTMNRG